jgi:hypothetical protein
MIHMYRYLSAHSHGQDFVWGYMGVHQGAEGTEVVGYRVGACLLTMKKFLIFNVKTVAFWWLLGVKCFVSE